MTDNGAPDIGEHFSAQTIRMATDPNGPAIEIDFNELLEHTKGMELSEQQQLELIQTYWNIAMQFVQMGFGLHPVQMAKTPAAPCGKDCISEHFHTQGGTPVVELKDDKSETPIDGHKELEPEGGAP